MQALPPEGIAGSVKAASFARGYILDALMNQLLVVRPKETWPAKLEEATIWASDAEWRRIVLHGLEIGIFCFILASQVP